MQDVVYRLLNVLGVKFEGNISAGVELSNLNMIVRILLSHSTDSIPILLLFWWP